MLSMKIPGAQLYFISFTWVPSNRLWVVVLHSTATPSNKYNTTCNKYLFNLINLPSCVTKMPAGSVEMSVAFCLQVITVDGLTSLTAPLQRKLNHRTSLMPAVCLSFSLFLSIKKKVKCLVKTFSDQCS